MRDFKLVLGWLAMIGAGLALGLAIGAAAWVAM